MTKHSVPSRIRRRANQILLRILVPLARCLIRVGVDYPAFAECAKLAFVRAASEEEKAAGQAPSVASVSLVSGINRAQVSGLLKDSYALDATKPSAVELAADIVHFWQHDSDFLRPDKKPKPLPFSKPFPSFSDLVKRYAKDVSAEDVEQELVALDAIRYRADGYLLFNKGFFIPADHRDRLLLALDRSVRCLLETLTHNTDPVRVGAGRIERLVYSRSLTRAQVEGLRPTIREAIEEFCSNLDRRIGDDETNREGFSLDPILDTHIAVGVFYAEDVGLTEHSNEATASRESQ